MRYERFDDLSASQRRFDPWRALYNLERPHEALGLDVPADHYQVSRRVFRESLPLIEYGPADQVHNVQASGIVHFRGRQFKVGRAFRGYRVAPRPSQEDDVWQVYFCYQPRNGPLWRRPSDASVWSTTKPLKNASDPTPRRANRLTIAPRAPC